MGKKLSRIEKLVKGSFQIAKYGTYAGVISSLGCIYSVPNPFSVSPDGRYVTTVIDESGDFRFEELNLDKPEFDTGAKLFLRI